MKEQALITTLSIVSIVLITSIVGHFMQPTGFVLRDFQEHPDIYSHKSSQIADHCERVIAPTTAHYRALCNTVGTEMCCKQYGIPGCSKNDYTTRTTLCLHKCIEDVRNQCRKSGRTHNRPGLEQNQLERTLP